MRTQHQPKTTHHPKPVQTLSELLADDPCELWAEYSPIGWANTSERAEQMPDDYNDYFVVG